MKVVESMLPGFYQKYKSVIRKYVSEDDEESKALLLFALFGVMGASGTMFLYHYVRARSRLIALKYKLVRLFGSNSSYFTLIGMVPWSSTNYGEWPDYKANVESIRAISIATRAEFEDRNQSWTRYLARKAWMGAKKRIWDERADSFTSAESLCKYVLRYVDHNTGSKSWEQMKAIVSHIAKRATGEPVEGKVFDDIRASEGEMRTVSERAEEAHDFVDNYLQGAVIDMVIEANKWASARRKISQSAIEESMEYAQINARTYDGERFKGIVGCIRNLTARFERRNRDVLFAANGDVIPEIWNIVLQETVRLMGGRWFEEMSPIEKFAKRQDAYDRLTAQVWTKLLIEQAWWTFFMENGRPRHGYLRITPTAWLENLRTTLQKIEHVFK